MIYNLFQKFPVRDGQLSFYGPGKSDDETDTDIINISYAGLRYLLLGLDRFLHFLTILGLPSSTLTGISLSYREDNPEFCNLYYKSKVVSQ